MRHTAHGMMRHTTRAASVALLQLHHAANVWQLPPRQTSSAASSWRAASTWGKRIKSFMGTGNPKVAGTDENQSGKGRGEEKSEKQERGAILQTRTKAAKGEVRGEEKDGKKEERRQRPTNTGDSGQLQNSAKQSASCLKSEAKDDGRRPPQWLEHYSEEFKPESSKDYRHKKIESTARIVAIATERVFDPSAVALLGMSASIVLGLGAVEGAMMCSAIPFVESYDSGLFVIRYAYEQLIPSCVWETQSAELVASAMGCDPQKLLQSLDPAVPADAQTLLQLCVLRSLRAVAAGFMLLAQVVRIGTIGAAAPAVLEDRVKAGWEPPILGFSGGPGLIIRLCGRESNVATTSLRRMGRRLFPVFEAHSSFALKVAQYSEGGRIPVFWSVRADRYGSRYSWTDFPVSAECLVKTSTGRNVLILEADGTNADDPLALGARALDLTIDDASQGFRRIQDLFQAAASRPSSSGPAARAPLIRTLRVYLGNSLEVFRSGGGYTYTLRHRVRYAQEVDVLIDSRAPVLSEILRWCERATAAQRDGRKIVLFQTSSREYFLSLQLLMAKYGYEIHDPLDWQLVSDLGKEKGREGGKVGAGSGGQKKTHASGEEGGAEGAKSGRTVPSPSTEALSSHSRQRGMMEILMADSQWDFPGAREREREREGWKGGAGSSKRERQEMARADHVHMSRLVDSLPRLIYYERSAETVNAVQALVNAGEVEAANSCALLDKEEGAKILRERNVDVLDNVKPKWAQQDQKLELPAQHSKHRSFLSLLASQLPSLVSEASHSTAAEDPAAAVAGGSQPSDKAPAPPSRGLHIVCSSEIYDDLFRQVRQWTRMGYPACDIQSELDRRFKDILKQSLQVHETVAEVTKDEKDEQAKEEQAGKPEVDLEPSQDPDEPRPDEPPAERGK